MLEPIFRKQCLNITADKTIPDMLWAEIALNYSDPKRHYHTLAHLNSLILELLPIKEMIQDWPGIVFSIAYHDIIYDPLKQNNEEKSAELAVSRLTLLNMSKLRIDKCKEQIIATKSHEVSADNDTNYFTDADLAILGSDPIVYNEYSAAIRKEFKLYPDLIYNPGRKKVLKHFLQMPAIYKTRYFKDKYETRARQNISNELQLLSQ